MSRIEKSDAQLDAEAEARRRALDLPKVEHGMDDPDSYDPPEFEPSGPPKPPPDPTVLRAFILELRRAFWYEVRDRIHQRQTSTSLSDELDARGWPKDTDEGGVGPPFSSWMHRYLRTGAGPKGRKVWDRGPDPRTRPAMESIYVASEWCHSVHTDHQRPGYTLSLCAEMLSQVARFGQEPEDLAWHFDLPLEDVEAMLLHALRRARSHRIDSEARLSREPGSEAPLPERRPYRPAA